VSILTTAGRTPVRSHQESSVSTGTWTSVEAARKPSASELEVSEAAAT
jgi:hypothetical protein